jgi:hypothetical protein
MSIYKPSRDKKKLVEEALKDLNPAIRDSAKRILNSLLRSRRKLL